MEGKKLKSLLGSSLVFISILFTQALDAQELKGAFIMSSVGGIQNASNNVMAFHFNSNSECLTLQNGSAVLIGERATGTFVIYCDKISKIHTLGIKVYPNPVASFAQVKFIKTPLLYETFTYSIWTANGRKVKSGKATGAEIFRGLTLDMRTESSGVYIIRIESTSSSDVLKFIKAN